jgi:outer membrane protein OmpA-like peptidoglycan-associated protein
MSCRRNAYLFCLPLLMVFLCVNARGLAMEDKPGGGPNQQNCSSAQMSAAKEKYDEGVKLINYEARRTAFQKAVDLCPSYAQAHNNLADAFEHLGLSKKKEDQKSLFEANKLLDEAAKYYSIAAKLKPNLLVPKIGLGDVYMSQGRYPLAVESYENALKLQPGAQGVKDRLNEAKRLAESDSKDKKMVKEASDITKEVKNSDLEKMYKVMGIENFTVADTARQSFNNILFDGWSSAIKPGHPINQLDEIGKALSSKDMESYRFVIEGHANKVGEFEPNMNVSNDRARVVKEYLVKNFKVDPEKIMTQGFGYTRPKHSPDTNEKNRRVEVLFIK